MPRGDYTGSMNQKRLVTALKRTILVFASIHLGLLVILALWRRDYNLINIFSILELTRIWPKLGQGLSNLIVGSLVGLLVLGLGYFVSRSNRYQR